MSTCLSKCESSASGDQRQSSRKPKDQRSRLIATPHSILLVGASRPRQNNPPRFVCSSSRASLQESFPLTLRAGNEWHQAEGRNTVEAQCNMPCRVSRPPSFISISNSRVKLSTGVLHYNLPSWMRDTPQRGLISRYPSPLLSIPVTCVSTFASHST
jgi:hypothetical protein